MTDAKIITVALKDVIKRAGLHYRELIFLHINAPVQDPLYIAAADQFINRVSYGYPAATITMTLNDVTVIEDGRLCLLDDPDVIKEAEKYGDPAVLLQKKWIPDPKNPAWD